MEILQLTPHQQQANRPKQLTCMYTATTTNPGVVAVALSWLCNTQTGMGCHRESRDHGAKFPLYLFLRSISTYYSDTNKTFDDKTVHM